MIAKTPMEIEEIYASMREASPADRSLYQMAHNIATIVMQDRRMRHRKTKGIFHTFVQEIISIVDDYGLERHYRDHLYPAPKAIDEMCLMRLRAAFGLLPAGLRFMDAEANWVEDESYREYFLGNFRLAMNLVKR